MDCNVGRHLRLTEIRPGLLECRGAGLKLQGVDHDPWIWGMAQGAHNAPRLWGDKTVRGQDKTTGLGSGIVATSKVCSLSSRILFSLSYDRGYVAHL